MSSTCAIHFAQIFQCIHSCLLHCTEAYLTDVAKSQGLLFAFQLLEHNPKELNSIFLSLFQRFFLHKQRYKVSTRVISEQRESTSTKCTSQMQDSHRFQHTSGRQIHSRFRHICRFSYILIGWAEDAGQLFCRGIKNRQT